MPDRTIIITGASDGIGAAAARQLAARGETVVLVGRSPDKTAALARELEAPYHLADFARLAEVRRLAEELRTYPRIDVLANNAGGIFGEKEITTDGFEKTLQVNHLAPFLLTNLLMEALLAGRAKVLNTSSVAARYGGDIDLADLGNDRKYIPEKAYGDAKLANILFTKELHRRFGDRGIATAAFHPGNVATNFAADSTTAMRFVYHTPLRRLLLVSPEKGTRTLLWLLDGAPGRDWAPGEYYEKHKVARTNPQAGDPELARAFWDRSAQMVGLAPA